MKAVFIASTEHWKWMMFKMNERKSDDKKGAWREKSTSKEIFFKIGLNIYTGGIKSIGDSWKKSIWIGYKTRLKIDYRWKF